MDLGRLRQGLGWLKEWDEREALKNLSCPIRALASQDDLIVTPETSHDIWTPYDLRMVGRGGHVLPMTQAEWCVEQIGDFINAL